MEAILLTVAVALGLLLIGFLLGTWVGKTSKNKED
jgi:ABC-type cobalt transport system substrate-binding protein